MYYTTFSQAIAAASPTPEIASLVFGALYSIILVFSGGYTNWMITSLIWILPWQMTRCITAIASADQILALAIPSITIYLSVPFSGPCCVIVNLDLWYHRSNSWAGNQWLWEYRATVRWARVGKPKASDWAKLSRFYESLYLDTRWVFDGRSGDITVSVLSD